MARLLLLQPGLGSLVTGRRPHTAPVTFPHSFSRAQRGGRCWQMWRNTHSGRQLSLQQLDSVIRSRLDNIRSAFSELDPDGTGRIPKDEFRRVLESLLSVYQNQLSALIDEVCEQSSETVDYREFLRSFSRAPSAHSCSGVRHGLQSHPMSLSEIQKILKEKVGGNLRNLIRAFRLFDCGGGGKIQRHQLRQVLDGCCVRLTDVEFQRLWNHCSPKNTSTISYEDVLEKLGFGDSHDFRMAPVCTKLEVCSRGITPPERLKQRKQRAEDPSVLPHRKLHALFDDKMRMNSTSVWRALQAFDTTGSGLVKQEVLRDVLSSFIFPMNPQCFQKLTSRYGVKAAEQVRWKHFLSKFMSPVQEDDPNSRSFENSDKDEDELNFQDIYPQLKEIFHLLDKKHAGQVPRAELRHLLERPNRTQNQILQPRLRCSQITELLKVLDPEHTGMIHRSNLERLNLEMKPDIPEEAEDPPKVEDLLQEKPYEPLSAALEALKLFDPQRSGNVTREDLRTLLSCCGISDFNKFLNLTYRPLTSPQPSRQPHAGACGILDVVFQRMRSGLQKDQGITHRPNGTLSERETKKTLEDSSVVLDDQDFRKFSDSLDVCDGRIESSSFQQKYEEATGGDRRRSEVTPLLRTAEECLGAMKTRIQSIHGNNLAAFLLMDRKRKGVVDRHDFKDLYNSLGFFCRQDEFEQLLDRLGLHPGGNLNYAGFVDVVENKGKTKQWTQAERVQQQLHELLSSEACYKWTSMSKVLRQTDSDGRRWILKNSLRRFLFTYSLPLTSKEFEKLWLRYDPEAQGRVEVCDFLEKLGVHHKQGVPSQKLNQQEAERPESSDSASLEHLQQIFNNEAFRDSLAHLDWRRDGTVTLEEMLSLLNTFSCRLQKGQLLKHLHSLNVSADENRETFSYVDFLSASEQKPQQRCERPPVTPDALRHTESLDDLSPDAALVKMRELVTASASDLFKAFSTFDQSRTGKLKALEFRQVLDSFCTRLSDKQFRFMLSKLEIDSEKCSVNWKDFLSKFQSQRTPISTERFPRRTKPRSPLQTKTSGISDHEQQLQEVVSGHLFKIPKELMNQDPSDGASFSKERLRQLREGLTDDQLEFAWRQIPVNEQKKLQNRDGLKSFSAQIGTIHTGGGHPTSDLPPYLSEPRGSVSAAAILQRTQDFFSKSAPQFSSRRPSSTGRPGTGSPAGSVERRLRGAVQRCWREIQRSCREENPQQDGLISTDCFLKILRSHGINVMQEQFERLAVKSDIMRNGCVSYPDFMRHFLLNLNPAETEKKFKRRRLPLPTTQVNQGVPSRGCVDVLLKIYDVVRSSWTSIKRCFLSYDCVRAGDISVQDFRKVLRQFSVNLTSDEFFHLCSYFDGESTGKICYNNFLWAFLH